MGAKGCHSGTATDVDHLALGWFDVEIPEGTDGRYGVARLEIEDIRGTDAGRAILTEWRRGDADIEAESPLVLLIACQGVIVATTALRVSGH